MRIVIFLCLLTNSAFGFTLYGTVAKVLAGERLVVKDDKGKKHIIRMAGIDSPAAGQRFHTAARDNLATMALNKKVSVEWDKYDDFCEKANIPKRKCWKVGRVLLDGTDLNLEQVRLGFAWHSPFRMSEQCTSDRAQYNEAESKAQEKKLGLWGDKKPVPPWEFIGRKRGLSSTKPRF